MKTDRKKREDCQRQPCYSDIHQETEALSAWNEQEVLRKEANKKSPILFHGPNRKISLSAYSEREPCTVFQNCQSCLYLIPCGSVQ